jgi:hypothetical protein
MNQILPGYHRTDPAVCEWVVKNFEHLVDHNHTVKLWVTASRQVLEQHK